MIESGKGTYLSGLVFDFSAPDRDSNRGMSGDVAVEALCQDFVSYREHEIQVLKRFILENNGKVA